MGSYPQSSLSFAFALIRIDLEKPPQLISIPILEVEKLIVICPGITADATVRIVSHWPCPQGILGGGHPEVEDSVYRSQIAYLAPVRADLDAGFVRVAKQYLTGD
jgi:hypothetical protein